MTDIPDRYTYADWHQQMTGIKHLIALSAAEYVSADERIEALKDRVETLESALTDAQAEIGKLRGEFEEKLEAIRAAYRTLKNGSLHDA